ncbi:MAG: threonine/serine exporter family protein [Eubacteriales bacterium]|nr:threonine/serine exporter family protein [Eubacteriales bacterium]
MTYQEENELMAAWTDIANAMFESGAEVKRIEKSLYLLAQSHGATNISSFTINSNINMTCTFPDGNIVSQSRRIVNYPSFDLKRFEELNEISRKCCETKAGAAEIREMLKKTEVPKSPKRLLIGAVIVGFAFSLFFGGGFADAIVSAILGGLIVVADRTLGRYLPNTIIYNFVMAFMLGIISGLTCKAFPMLNNDKILIGDIMLLVPGLFITGAMRDMLTGDTISGTMRFIESILWAGALAMGFITAFLVIGGNV